MGWKWFGTETAAGLETRDGHCCPLCNRPEGGINLHILLTFFCFRLKFPLWIFNPPLGWRQYTEKCQYTLRLKLNILSADQAVGENMLKEIQILFFLHSLIFCSLYKFWQFNLVGWGRIFAWKRVPSPKVSALKAFYKTRFTLIFAKHLMPFSLALPTQQNMISRIVLILRSEPFGVGEYLDQKCPKWMGTVSK